MIKKRIIGVILIAIIIILGLFIWKVQGNKKSKIKEVLNCEYHIEKEEYEEQYNCFKDNFTMKKGAEYKLKWNVTLSSGDCVLKVENSNKEKLWEEKVTADDNFEKDITLEGEGDAVVYIEINEETEGKTSLIIDELVK
ncbi:hypothetical protein [[Clostridium] polysaccharolyticum]|uniref:Uncharacterized protein n=1 Tax=[Clostridium] polysaccharolyticum TaxID=29364 RepID=A0A1H9ZYA4_9FIRM|nr:hypothetical protein [[Clostridium] polysaccharolyticum]SES86344.1 hypothetical protein SAMN04487772_104151 [[Clostridium] polysaccharolyticum]